MGSEWERKMKVNLKKSFLTIHLCCICGRWRPACSRWAGRSVFCLTMWTTLSTLTREFEVCSRSTLYSGKTRRDSGHASTCTTSQEDGTEVRQMALRSSWYVRDGWRYEEGGRDRLRNAQTATDRLTAGDQLKKNDVKKVRVDSALEFSCCRRPQWSDWPSTSPPFSSYTPTALSFIFLIFHTDASIQSVWARLRQVR